jgi:hypothetical protein
VGFKQICASFNVLVFRVLRFQLRDITITKLLPIRQTHSSTALPNNTQPTVTTYCTAQQHTCHRNNVLHCPTTHSPPNNILHCPTTHTHHSKNILHCPTTHTHITVRTYCTVRLHTAIRQPRLSRPHLQRLFPRSLNSGAPNVLNFLNLLSAACGGGGKHSLCFYYEISKLQGCDDKCQREPTTTMQFNAKANARRSSWVTCKTSVVCSS